MHPCAPTNLFRTAALGGSEAGTADRDGACVHEICAASVKQLSQETYDRRSQEGTSVDPLHREPDPESQGPSGPCFGRDLSPISENNVLYNG